MINASVKKEGKVAGAYVVIDEPISGWKPAVYHVDYCLRVGDRAFVARSSSFRKALVVPASWVFESKAEAAAYAARRGSPRWCVILEEDKHGGISLEIVEAHVREGLRENFYGTGYRYRSYILRKGAKEPEYRHCRSFATEKEARREAGKLLREKIKAAARIMREAERREMKLQTALKRLESSR